MTKINNKKKRIICTLLIPLYVVEIIISVVILVKDRAKLRALKLNNILQLHESGKIKH